MPVEKIVEYLVSPRYNSSDLYAAADACNRRLIGDGLTWAREEAEAQIASCHPLIAADLKVDAVPVDFDRWCEVRETSAEIANAIWSIAHSLDEANRIWEDPTEAELISIWEIVTNNGQRDAADYYWGAAENNWAPLAQEK